MSEPLPFSRPIEISAIGHARSVNKIDASSQERQKLSAELGLVDIGRLSAELGVKRDEDGTIHIDGRVTADLVQNCVVSLDPVAQSIDEEITLRFIQQRPGEAARAAKSDQIYVDPTLDDPPEVLTGDIIDLGHIVLEHFILATEPYPHAPGVSVPAEFAEDVERGNDSPFAVLERLGLREAKDS